MNAIKGTIKDQKKMAIAFWLLVVAIVFCGIMYFVMINKTVFNIVASQKAQSKANAITTTIGELQSENMALNNKITQEYAQSLGFEEAANPQYISYKDNGSSLSLK